MLKADLQNKVQSFASLGYSIERIAVLLGLNRSDTDELFLRVRDLDDPLSIAYRRGKMIGEYNVDVELQKQAEAGDGESIKLREDRNAQRECRDLKQKLFGV